MESESTIRRYFVTGLVVAAVGFIIFALRNLTPANPIQSFVAELYDVDILAPGRKGQMRMSLQRLGDIVSLVMFLGGLCVAHIAWKEM